MIILNFEKGKGLGTNTNNSEQKYPAMPMMCGNQSHFKYFSYCEECAISGCDVDTVFYCSKCQSDRKNTHIAHRN